jgi:hypothetical protein
MRAVHRVTDVYLEVGTKRSFACAIEWPGWCRAGKDEQHALEALAAFAPRYEVVARQAGVRFPKSAAEHFDIVERVAGSATTDFGAPGAIPNLDRKRLTPAQAKRLTALLNAAWDVFGRVVDTAPSELRKGPRGGGRDRDKIVDHVLGAEVAYAHQIGLRHEQPKRDDARAVSANRADIIAALHKPKPDVKWPPAYAVRRIAWHVLDHAWETEDRTQP